MSEFKFTRDGECSWSLPTFADDESRLYWMSFCDGDKPKGQQFLGVSIVRVYGADMNAMAIELLLRFPFHDPEEGPWIAAACRKAHMLGINPGGEVLCNHLPDNLPDRPNYPENVALTPEQLTEFGIRRDGTKP